MANRDWQMLISEKVRNQVGFMIVLPVHSYGGFRSEVVQNVYGL